MTEFKKNIYKQRFLYVTPIATDPLSLGYVLTTGPDACTDFVASPVTRYCPTGLDFVTATAIYQDINGTVPAQAGYYSDGAKWKYWDEATFTSTGFC